MKIETTFDNGSLGSRNDEERSEMRYVMWIAFRESSNLWTHIALLWSMPVWESIVIIFGLMYFGTLAEGFEISPRQGEYL